MGMFLIVRIFGLLSLSLYSQHFSRYILRPSSGVFCRIREFISPRIYLIHGRRSFKFRQPGPGTIILDILNNNQDWTRNLQMISLKITFHPNAYNRYAFYPAGQFGVNFWGLINVISLSTFWILITIPYDFLH